MVRNLIEKTYYKTLLQEGEKRHPIQVLGDAFFEEHKKAVADLSHIRFSQGEIYFHNKDYEAAINKWENVNGELEPWAKKNVGDAYYELEWLIEAEKKYKSVNTNNKTLSVETALQLFSLYRDREMVEKAYTYIKKAISLDRDYSNVMDIAKVFYEEQQDWENLIELVVGEAMRTKTKKWFDILIDCIEKGYSKTFAPDYYVQLLNIWLKTDESQFVKFIVSLWKSYRSEEYFLTMVNLLNEFLIRSEVKSNDSRKEIASLYKQCYQELLSGRYLVKDIQMIIPNLLAVWLKMEQKALYPSAAVIAWNEIFPSSFDYPIFKEAEKNVFHYESKGVSLEEIKELMETLFTWAQINKLDIGLKSRWYSLKIVNLEKKHLFVSGLEDSGVSSVINGLLQENLLDEKIVSACISSNDEIALREISDQGINSLSDLENITENTMVDVNWKSKFLQQLDYSLLYTPVINNESLEKEDVWNNLNVADGVLIVLDAYKPITEEEMRLLVKLQEQANQVPIYFVVNNIDSAFRDVEANKFIDSKEIKLREFFSNTKVYPYSSLNPNNNQDLVDFIQSNFSNKVKAEEKDRASKLLQFIRKTLTEILNKRITKGNFLNDKVTFNEDVLERLNGLLNQLKDTKDEKEQIIINEYHLMKEEVKDEIKENVPKLIRECSEEITEESDFKTIHEKLNSRMNEKLSTYFISELIPKFHKSLQIWIGSLKEDLHDVQNNLNEMGKTFNTLDESNKMELKCDFQIINDWQRDINRMLSRIELEEENILNRTKPTQILLKSAGLLLGSIQQNKGLLCSQYKKYIENSNYDEIAVSMISKYLFEFDLFEKTLKTDLAIFFDAPISELDKYIHKVIKEIENTKKALLHMNEKPEIFYDPLKLFEVRLLQCEIIKNSIEEIPLASVLLPKE
ncbi:hypothetical protein [Evansella vedderi]|uniref:hypothetical protein n=1 Tax=Evansella vedderi TaxID=38282 RepID=UPI0027D91ACE|nr:hypothetical protein [Evansella vedderi]